MPIASNEFGPSSKKETNGIRGFRTRLKTFGLPWTIASVATLLAFVQPADEVPAAYLRANMVNLDAAFHPTLVASAMTKLIKVEKFFNLK